MSNRLILHEQDNAIHVVWQPDGKGEVTRSASVAFTPALTKEDREDLRWYLEDYLRAPFAVYEDRGQTIRSQLDALGQGLFASLFGAGKPGNEAYRNAIAADPARCELIIQSQSPSVLGQPWEIMTDPGHPEPLALRFAGMSRELPNCNPIIAVPQAKRLRVLLIIARPFGVQDVSHQIVARPLLRRLAAVAGKVEITVLRPPTFDVMKEILAAARKDGEPFHIVHFDGHGDYNKSGVLFFEHSPGVRVKVSAAEFAHALAENRVPVVILNACRTAMLDDVAGPEASVATGLLQHGVAAVVAMSHKVYAVAAAEFMAVFYQALFEGATVAKAVGEGRKQLRRMNERPSPKGPHPLADWMVPVLYAHREVEFPHLKVEKAGERPDLAKALDDMRARGRPVSEGLHEPGSIESIEPFYGRDIDFLRLERWMPHRPVVVVHGSAGSGKTELAKAFARWWRDTGGPANPELVFFHSFEPGIASFGLDGVVSAIGLAIFGTDFARRSQAEREAALLVQMARRRMLLVWDNFETVHSMPDPKSVTPPLDESERNRIRDFLTRVLEAKSSAVIITSRSPEYWLSDGPARLAIGGLQAEDASRYADHLIAGVPRAAERRADRKFAELMEALDGHPLSMRLLLPRLAENDAAELLRSLHSETPLDSVFGGKDGRRHDSLIACIHASFRHLPEHHRRLLPAVALFNGITDVNVLALFSNHTSVPQRFARVSWEEWIGCLDTAVEYGILTQIGGSLSFWRIPPALPSYLLEEWRSVAGDTYANEYAAARGTLTAAYADYGDWLGDKIGGWDADKAFAIISSQRGNFWACLEWALSHSRHEDAQLILQPLSRYFSSCGLSIEAMKWANYCRTRLEDDDGAPPALDTLAGRLWRFTIGVEAEQARTTGNLNAAKKKYRILADQLGALDSDEAKKTLSDVYDNIGIIAQMSGDLATAETSYRKALDTWTIRDARWTSYHHLGMVAAEKGDLASAEKLYNTAMAIAAAHGDRSGMSRFYHQYGILEQLRGRPELAENWHRKSLAIAESLGAKPEMAASYHQLGTAALEMGHWSSAETWFRSALLIQESIGDRRGVEETYYNLGIAAMNRGMAIESLDWIVRAAAVSSDSSSPNMDKILLIIAAMEAFLGSPAVKGAWQRATGAPIPPSVQDALCGRMDRLDHKEISIAMWVMAKCKSAGESGEGIMRR
ncbi:MAG: tetratricopeptide repeat protein [Alphaproteobacteria bacterium]|nr:tetratricopeptide repeat protein [Alphaproteobacteria bacterium]